MMVIVVVESVGDCDDVDDGEMKMIMMRERGREGRGWEMMGKGKLWEAAIAFK